MTTPLATLAQIKQHIGNFADATDDILLQRLALAASEFIERRCARTFGQAGYVERRNGNGLACLSLRAQPVTAVHSLSINGVAVAEATAWDGRGWALESSWRLVLLGGLEFTRGGMNVVVSYTAGYTAATMPDDLVQACCHMAALMYKERDRIGLSSKSVGGESISYSGDVPDVVLATIQTHRAVAIPT